MRMLRGRSPLSVRIAGALAVACGAALAVVAHPACVANPDIDGSKVPPIGSDASVPECAPLCNRIAALCGYAPVDCLGRCAAFDADQRVCVGRAPSCRAALQDCAPAPVDDAGEDGGESDASESEEAEPDAAEDASDAAHDASGKSDGAAPADAAGGD